MHTLKLKFDYFRPSAGAWRQETIWSYYLQTNNRLPGNLTIQAFVFKNTIEDTPIEDMAEWQVERGSVNNNRYSMLHAVLHLEDTYLTIPAKDVAIMISKTVTSWTLILDYLRNLFYQF